MATHNANTWMAALAVGAALFVLLWVGSNLLIGIPLVLLIGGGIYYFGRPFHCEMCKKLLLRNRFVWDLEKDKKTVVCFMCNKTLQRQHRRQALEQAAKDLPDILPPPEERL